MPDRYELNDILCNLLGTENVYFQPPENVKISYPAILYKLARFNTDHADNDIYRLKRVYELTIVDKNPDSTIPETLIRNLRYCSLDRYYVSDNLHHWVLTLYY